MSRRNCRITGKEYGVGIMGAAASAKESITAEIAEDVANTERQGLSQPFGEPHLSPVQLKY